MAHGSTDPWLSRVRLLNDEARRHLPDGMLVISHSITSLPIEDQAAILDHVRTFDDFEPRNDPWGEHAFGAFEHVGQSVFWKIDYYDRDEQLGSPDPSDPAVTKRVLTILLAEEY